MLLAKYNSVERAWGSGTLWIDMSVFGLKGMPIIGTSGRVLSNYDKKFIEDFARGGSYLEIYKRCTQLLEENERLVLGIEYRSLYVYVVEHHGNYFNVVKRARVGLFYGRDPKELAKAAVESLEDASKTYSKNPRIHSFLGMFKKEEIDSKFPECINTFESISGIPLSNIEKAVIGRAVKLKI